MGDVFFYIRFLFLFIYLSASAYAMEIADFFISQLGLDGMGALVIVISVLIGAFLGGFGGLLGRSLFELIDEFLRAGDGPEPTPEPSAPEPIEEPEPEEHEPSEESEDSE